MAEYNGTITSGGNAQTAMAADVNRNTLFVQNTDDTDFWIRFGGTAAAAPPSIIIPAGESATYDAEWRPMITQAMSIFGATTGKTFTIVDTKM